MKSVRTPEDLSTAPVWRWTALGCFVFCGVALVSGFVIGRDGRRPNPEPRVHYRILPMPGALPKDDETPPPASAKDLGPEQGGKSGGRT